MDRAEALAFIDYLEVKRTVDDRALNQHVVDSLRAELAGASGKRLNALEVGAGIGTMLTRLIDWQVVGQGTYTAVDINPELVTAGRRRMARYARDNAWPAACGPAGEIVFTSGEIELSVDFQAADVLEYCQRSGSRASFDLLIAHAFLDLLDLPTALPLLLQTLSPGSLFYFTLNFDGITHFEPPLDPALDAQIEGLYHATMNERLIHGKPSGDPHTGRHLLGELLANGADILAAGPSDWLVHPVGGRYPASEAGFLHHILDMIETALNGHLALDPEVFSDWIQRRRAQVEACALVYLAHQIDVLGRCRSEG